MDKVLEQIVATVLIASRWLMAPLYLGLIAAMVVVIVEFFTELVTVAASVGKLYSSELILAVLKVIVANPTMIKAYKAGIRATASLSPKDP